MKKVCVLIFFQFMILNVFATDFDISNIPFDNKGSEITKNDNDESEYNNSNNSFFKDIISARKSLKKLLRRLEMLTSHSHSPSQTDHPNINQIIVKYWDNLKNDKNFIEAIKRNSSFFLIDKSINDLDNNLYNISYIKCFICRVDRDLEDNVLDHTLHKESLNTTNNIFLKDIESTRESLKELIRTLDILVTDSDSESESESISEFESESESISDFDSHHIIQIILKYWNHIKEDKYFIKDMKKKGSSFVVIDKMINNLDLNHNNICFIKCLIQKIDRDLEDNVLDRSLPTTELDKTVHTQNIKKKRG